MDKNIGDEVVDNLIRGLDGETPSVIRVFGGDCDIRNYVMREVSLRVDSVVTDRRLGDGVYSVDLDYLVEKCGS